MRVNVLTLFPEMFTAVTESSILGRAGEKGILDIKLINIRDYTLDKHRKTDDTPFGGGPGMVMTAQPVFDALRSLGLVPRDSHATVPAGTVAPSVMPSVMPPETDGAACAQAACEPPKRTAMIYMSPRGKILDQEKIEQLSACDEITILCGHYEGVDQRIIDAWGMEEISIGDYILTGGELPAMVLIDSVSRFIPEVLGSRESATEESIYSGLLEFDQYTKPREYEGLGVPEVLVGGNHKLIHLRQYEQSLRLTAERRPDLFRKYMEKDKELSKDEKKILESIASKAQI